MGDNRLIRRYAEALFEIAREQKVLDAVRDDFTALAALGERCPEWRTFAGHYAVSRTRRAGLLQKLFEGRLHPVFYRFLLLLEEGRDLRLLDGVYQAFIGLCKAAQGITAVNLTVAQMPSSDQLQRFNEKAAARIGGAIETAVAVDPTLIGGFRVRVGDTIHDYSIAGQLDAWRRQVSRAGG